MILHRLSHWDASRTKDVLMPFDPAFFLTLLKVDSPLHDSAVHEACLHITLINEAMANAQASDRPIDLRYARSPTGETIHLIAASRPKPIFWKISEDVAPHSYSLRFLLLLAEKNKGSARVLSASDRPSQDGKLLSLPWEWVL